MVSDPAQVICTSIDISADMEMLQCLGKVTANTFRVSDTISLRTWYVLHWKVVA